MAARLIVRNVDGDEENGELKLIENTNLLAPRMNGPRDCSATGYIGATGSGKTNLAAHYIRNEMKWAACCIITSDVNECKFNKLLEINEERGEEIVKIIGCRGDIYSIFHYEDENKNENENENMTSEEEDEDEYEKEEEENETENEENSDSRRERKHKKITLQELVLECEQWLTHVGEGKQSILGFDDLSWKELGTKAISDNFRMGRKKNFCLFFNTQTYNCAEGTKMSNAKSEIMSNLTDLILFKTAKKSQVTSIFKDFSVGVPVKEMTILHRFFTKCQYDFMHIDTRVDNITAEKVQNTDWELEHTGIEYNSAQIRWNGDNHKMTLKACQQLKRLVSACYNTKKIDRLE